MVTGNQSASLEPARLELASEISQPARVGQIERGRQLLFDALGVDLLLWVAMYNGYPTVFSDTGAYLLTGAFFVLYTPFRAHKPVLLFRGPASRYQRIGLRHVGWDIRSLSEPRGVDRSVLLRRLHLLLGERAETRHRLRLRFEEQFK